MQFKLSALVLLASIASVIAQTPGEKLDDTLNDINNGIDGVQTEVNGIISDVAGATTVIGDIKSGATSVVGDIKSFVTSVAGDLNFITLLPTITIAPTNIENYWNSVKTRVENDKDVAETVWDAIKTGLYPPEVSQWVDSLPTQMRAEASQKLTEWADDMGSSASSNRGAVALGAMGVAGVLALAMAL